MKKEEKKIIKDKEKQIKQLLKQYAKEYGYKISSNTVFKKNDNFFVHSVWFLRYADDTLNMVVWNYIKPYYYDNIFWEIFKMLDNINSKDSLRANGAFAFPSIKISEKYFEIDNQIETEKHIQKLFEYITQVHNKAISSVDNNVTKFNHTILEQKGYLREELIKAIANIQLGDYKKALHIVEKEISYNKRGGFINNDKDIYCYIEEYCKNKL